MQETRNNCFGSKICRTTLRQAKTGKHECRNITATVPKIVLTCFRLTKDRATYFRPETIVASFLLLMVLLSKVLLNHSWKRQFVVLLQQNKRMAERYLSKYIICIWGINGGNLSLNLPPPKKRTKEICFKIFVT